MPDLILWDAGIAVMNDDRTLLKKSINTGRSFFSEISTI
jgi:hypothetical protein